ncbi:hypothetical protein [Salarchaeum japonicum]|uniref:Uncharacterized protein n=1 Tax=Salarchaeum japonicum TaxID=555573 RepID=A0AAV3SXU3_9EURY|nr:hypothetical protein [Salarchaeum japonicum]
MADTWIGVTDSRPTPLLNSLIATIESGYKPEKILIFVPEDDKEILSTIRQRVETICREYDTDAELNLSTTPSVNNPKALSQHVSETLQEQGDTNAVSISSGSRLINACLIGASNQLEQFQLDHLYTLEGPDQANLESTIYPMIPRPEMNLIDYRENSDLDLTGPGDHGSTDDVYKITREQLPLLFNALYSTGNTTVSVDHKSNSISTLYQIELDRGNPASIRFTTDSDQYKYAVIAYLPKTHAQSPNISEGHFSINHHPHITFICISSAVTSSGSSGVFNHPSLSISFPRAQFIMSWGD